MVQIKVKTEAEALQEILEWSKERPKWQQDALRRLCRVEELSSSDLKELVALCKDETLHFQPLSVADLPLKNPSGPKTSLKSIRNVKNVNALAGEQTLTFERNGVTIVYGDNGAGKSGYVRILKNACRARISNRKDGEILGNVYEHGSGPPSADLEFVSEAQEQKIEWTAEGIENELLGQISVFDSRTANVHVEAPNDIAYTPFPLKILERLVATCKSIKSELDAEVSTIKAQTPTSVANPKCSDGTKVHGVVRSLSAKSNAAELRQLASMSKDEEARMRLLSSDFAEQADIVTKRLQGHMRAIERLLALSKGLSDQLTQEKLDKYFLLKKTVKEKTEAAQKSSEIIFRDEPLRAQPKIKVSDFSGL